MNRSFVFDDGASRKFWNIVTKGVSLTVTFGRIGTAGQTQTKAFASPDACEKEANALVASKLKKGYAQGKAEKTAPAKAAPTKAAPTKAAPAKTAPAKAAPTTAKTKLSAADMKALLRAIELGLAPKVKAALAKNPDVNVIVPLKYEQKTTPLFAAVAQESAEIVGMILGAGARIADADEYGRQALQQTRWVPVAKLLLEAGADVNASDKRKSTALHSACEFGDADMVELLLERGANVEAKNKEGKTPYVVGQKLAIRALLKKHGAKGLEKTDGRALSPKTKRAAPSDLDVEGGAIGVDGDGNVWIGGSSAIFRWDGKQLTSFDFKDSFSVDQIAAGPAGTVYFSTNWGLVTLAGDAWRLYSTEDSELHDQHITYLAVDRKGRAHVMGYGGEEKVDRPIAVFDGKRFTVLTAGNGLPKGLETECLAFDAKNQLIFGTSAGVVFPDGTTWKVPGESSGLSDIRALAVDGDVVWAGAWRGAHRIEAGKSKHFETENGVNAFCLDGHALWIGMSYGGLLQVDGERTKAYKSEGSGLTEDDVEGLALGKDGSLWIAASSAVFVAKDGVIRVFDGKTADAKPAKPAKAKEEPKPKKTKLAALPTKPFVPVAKLPKHVVDAVRATKIAGLPTEALFAFIRPSIGIEIGKPADAGIGASKLGGRPDLPDGTAWPSYEDEDDRFLPFLLQVNLADVAAHDTEGLLPKKGVLSFFCDTIPDELEESHVAFNDGTKKPKRLEWPEDLVDRKKESDFVAQLPEHALTFYPTWTLPSAAFLAAFAELSDADETALDKLDTALHAKDPKGSSTTRLLGWPDSLQGEIVDSSDVIALLQLDASMRAPKALAQVFSFWGNGLAHYIITRTHLAERKLSNAGATLAYT